MTVSGRLFYGIFFFFSLVGVQYIYAGTDVTGTKESQLNPLITISSGDSIQIEMKNIPLHDALNAVTQRSKINFEVPESLLKDKITLRFTCKAWPEAIKRMLRKYNIAYGWEKNELKTVFIFERGTGKVLQLIPTPENELPPTDQTVSNKQPKAELLDEQIIPSLPPIPAEEEKIIEVKFGSQGAGRRKKPDMENMEDILQGLPPELPPDPSGEKDENASDFLVPDEPALMNVK